VPDGYGVRVPGNRLEIAASVALEIGVGGIVEI
jgi:hypothetical protein